MTEKERLEYYKNKYGFVPLSEKVIEKKKIKGIVKLLWALPIATIVILLFTIVVCLPGLILCLLGLKKTGDKIVYFSDHIIFNFILFLLNVHVNIVGEKKLLKELMNKKEKLCFISNHTSMLDILILEGKLHLECGFIAKSILKFVPVLNLFLWASHCVLISRTDIKQSSRAIKRGARMIQKGQRMLVFPEGTRSKTGEIAPFKHGSFKLAVLSGATVVPLTIKGVRNALEDRKKCFGRTDCTISIGKPVSFDNLDRNGVFSACEKVEKDIRRVYSSL